MNRLSINSNGDALRDQTNYVNFVTQLKPPVLLQIMNSALAQKLAAVLPETMVILRLFPDADLEMDAAKWVRDNAGFAQGGIWLNVLNERRFGQASIDWCLKAMQTVLDESLDVRLIVGNWGIGSYQYDQVPMLAPILQMCSNYPDKFMLGLHEYFAGHIASGLGGGREAEMIQPETWPRGQDAKGIARYHVGRHKWICDYARTNSYEDARIVITEFGADRLDDVKGWQQSLIKTDGFDQIRGYHTLKSQWEAWYTSEWFQQSGLMADKDTAHIYHEMLKYADENLFDPMIVGACVFGWNTNRDWIQFDVSGDYEWQALMLAGATAPPVEPPTEPPTEPPVDVVTIPRDELETTVVALRLASDKILALANSLGEYLK